MIQLYSRLINFFKNGKNSWGKNELIEEINKIHLELAIEWDKDNIKARERGRLLKLLNKVSLNPNQITEILDEFEKL